MKKYIEFLKEQPDDFKRNGLFIFLTYFFAIFSYPFVRASTGAIFYESYSSNEYSFATFVAISFLMLIIFLSNKLQDKLGVHKLYLLLGGATILCLGGFFIIHSLGFKPAAFGLFATKEIYIVLLIHLCLAFANGYFSMEQLKRLYGPLGAVGSIGGVVGGQLTSNFAKNYGTTTVFFISLILILFAMTSFYQTKNAFKQTKDTLAEGSEERLKPLESIRNIKKYVVLIAGIVSLSQLIIFVADLQFNIIFEEVVTSKDARTAYLGELFSYTNMGTLFFQLFVIPFALMKFPIKYLFYFIPFMYLILIFGGLGLGAGSLYVVAGVFVLMKAIDYSLFSAAKEVMYHPLSRIQKYGAKYITDMFVYRLSKASISLIMSFFIIKEVKFLNTLQVVCICGLLVFITLLFKEQKKNKFKT